MNTLLGFSLFILFRQDYAVGIEGGVDNSVQRFIREPPDQTAKIGEQVTLPCRVENKMGKLQWTRDDFGLGQGRDLTGFDRYEMTGSDAEGDYTLNIYPVQLEDDAVFQCQVGAATGVAPIRSRYATLTVTVPPEPPVILNGDTLRVAEDKMITFECVSKAGKPAAEITWFDGNNIPIRQDVETVIENLADGKRQNTISMLRKRIRRKENLSNITCEAQNVAESVPRRTTVLIYVEYPPHVTLHYQPHTLQEGHGVTFKCSADANPPEVNYRWYLENTELLGQQDQVLNLQTVNRTIHGAVLKCVVRNRIGRSEETHTLSISYPPTWRNQPEDTAAEEGEAVELACLADAYPPPRYAWYRSDDSETVISKKRNLTFILTVASQGSYNCRVEVPGFNNIVATAKVLLKGPPKVTGAELVQAELGEQAELSCTADGIPTPHHVLWTQQGSVLGTGERRSIHSHVRSGVLHSSLLIQAVHESEFGLYNCTASNIYGVDYKTIHLKQKEDTSLLVPLGVGVSGGVFITLFILVLVIQCRRTRTKPSQEDISDKVEWEVDPISKDKHLLQVQEEEVPLNQHFNMMNQSPLADKFRNINLNVQDPHYSAVYGNPYLRSAVEGPYYGETYEHSYNMSDDLLPRPGYRHSPNGSADAQYIIRQDLRAGGLATHV